ncbi:MAG: beta-galactosidase trimerization domain-containing protein [Planctomycetes bacterium]|nr:beta-galactosidase trimerization domain-containing protein [Planctomycetota bacterium]
MAKEKPRIVLDESAIERNEPLMGLVSAPPGEYELVAVDTYGRHVVDEKIRVADRALPFSFGMELAAAVSHRLRLVRKGRKVAETAFKVAPPRSERNWDDYHVCVWARYPQGFYELLREAGVNASMAYRMNDFSTIVENEFPFYVEQVAPTWLAYYHRSGIPNWTVLLQQQKDAYRKHRPRPGKGLHRTVCLSKRVTYDEMERRIAKEVLDHRFYRPLYYTAADEAGITDLTTPLDLCCSPECLGRFREWLKASYRSLNALNREWGTSFATWGKVMPRTADQVLNDAGGNYSPWADHRDFMDHVLGEAFERARSMMRKYDAEALSGLEGGQMPAAYGGYNWLLLGAAADVLEIYNIGHNCEIVRSLHPGKVMLKAVFATGTDWDVHRVWYEFLHGDIGVILWDNGEERARWIHPDRKYSRHAVKLAPHFRELHSGTARLLRGAKRVDDPIGIHFSQPSIRAAWIRETQEQERQGIDWLNQGSAWGRQHSEFLRVRESLGALVEDLGLQYRYHAYPDIEEGLSPAEVRIMFLPESAAISDREARAFERYVKAGGILVSDALAGVCDGHVKRRGKGALDKLFGIKRADGAFFPFGESIEVLKAQGPFAGLKGLAEVSLKAAEPGITANGASVCGDCSGVPALMYNKVGRGMAVYLNVHNPDYRRLRLDTRSAAAAGIRALYATLIRAARVSPAAFFRGGNPVGVEIHRYMDGRIAYIGIGHNPHLRVSELGGDEAADNGMIMRPHSGTLAVGRKQHVYDVRRGRYIGLRESVPVKLPGAGAVILAVMPYRVTGIEAAFRGEGRPGSVVALSGRIKVSKGVPGRHVVHMSIRQPDGRTPHYFERNLEAPNGRFSCSIPLGHNAPAGRYSVTLADTATGVKRTVALTVRR